MNFSFFMEIIYAIKPDLLIIDNIFLLDDLEKITAISEIILVTKKSNYLVSKNINSAIKNWNDICNSENLYFEKTLNLIQDTLIIFVNVEKNRKFTISEFSHLNVISAYIGLKNDILEKCKFTDKDVFQSTIPYLDHFSRIVLYSAFITGSSIIFKSEFLNISDSICYDLSPTILLVPSETILYLANKVSSYVNSSIFGFWYKLSNSSLNNGRISKGIPFIHKSLGITNKLKLLLTNYTFENFKDLNISQIRIIQAGLGIKITRSLCCNNVFGPISSTNPNDYRQKVHFGPPSSTLEIKIVNLNSENEFGLTMATCSLNQWALDFEGNCDRILKSIIEAKKQGAVLRIGPELEITGYGCYDHFLENDTYTHSWEMLCRILNSDEINDIIVDLGIIIIYNKKILLIRPKLCLANNGNYREMRYFSNWNKRMFTDNFCLPEIVSSITGQVCICDSIIVTQDTSIGYEMCEELFTPHIDLALNGVEIICNSSGSHHELGKINTRINLIQEAMSKVCIYLYANQQGCDGDRLYYDGSAMIIVNGFIVAQGPQFSLNDVDVVSATIDLDDIRSYRNGICQGIQSLNTSLYNKIYCSKILSKSMFDLNSEGIVPVSPIIPKYYSIEEEIAKSNNNGFFLALSGGSDSCATALTVYIMCKKVVDALKNQNTQVASDLCKILGWSKYSKHLPETPEELASPETKRRSKELSNAIGSYHVDFNMDNLIKVTLQIFSCVTGKQVKFKQYGGTDCENIALQNLQARFRMVLSYFFSQLLPWVRGKSGLLLVLGSTNLDECLRGYFTKYDCSSADINPIGTISKTDLNQFIKFVHDNFKLPLLQEFLVAKPTAELEPFSEEYTQSDEVDMGFTYDELNIFGKLRKINKCGPYSMFLKLIYKWKSSLPPMIIAEKVKRLWFYYSVNRHKMTTLTPACHTGPCSLDDNRYDLRPFLYNIKWSWQFKRIDDELKTLEIKTKNI
ncbi:hypothetical protein PMAC_002662 [Pneumocystis sp. 'macacae']|nr:hypothetical protein PMAC_002662 [Pneumocystis sp. 'macacae']